MSRLLAPLLDIPLPTDCVAGFAARGITAPAIGRPDGKWAMASARTQPVVLALEDLHWADPTTLDVVPRHRRTRSNGAFVRSPHRPARVPAALGHALASRHDLARAARPQPGTANGWPSLPARHALPKEVIEGVTERTGGVPLFVEEVTRLLLERGEQGGIQAHPADPATITDGAARPARAGSRGGANRRCDRTRFLIFTVSRTWPTWRKRRCKAALERLAEADILLVQGLPPEAEYRFKHALIQDAAYENLLKSRRQVLHRRVAEILRDQFAARAAAEPELLAHHFTQAAMTEAAIEWWGKAGRRSLERSALVEAAEQITRALNQIATLPGSPRCAARRSSFRSR